MLTITDCSGGFEINERCRGVWAVLGCSFTPLIPCLWLQYLVMESQKNSPPQDLRQFLVQLHFFFPSPAQIPQGIVWAGPGALQG